MPAQPASRQHEPAPSAESVWSLAVFWLAAFTASALFAAVLIAPQWNQRETLVGRVRRLSAESKRLSDRRDHLRRVLEALEHDPEFVGEIARSELDFGLPQEQRLPAPIAKPKRLDPPTEPEPDPWTPIVQLFATDPIVRRTALVTAAALVLTGLIFFHPSREPAATPRT